VSVQTLAANNLYNVFSVGYSDVEFIQEPDKNLGYIMVLVISLTLSGMLKRVTKN
jgi:hypothetical protein